MFSNGYGFVVDYIAEVLKWMRDDDHSDRYQQHFTLGSDISTHDRDGIHKTFSGLMKILFPHGEATVNEIEEILRVALEGRKRVKDQILRIDPTMAEVKFGYQDKGDTWIAVTTLEEDEYPEYYHQTRGGGAMSDATGGAITAQTGIVKPDLAAPTESALFEGHRDFQDGQRGVSFTKLLGPYFHGATEITIADPFIRKIHQAQRLLEVVEVIASLKDPADEIAVQVRTTAETESQQWLQKQYEVLSEVQDAAQSVGIKLEIEFADPFHDRWIKTNTAWRIILGRGLDIFQPFQGGALSLATRYQEHRQVRDFGITYIRES
jgi:ATP-dependent Lon protease